MYLPRTGTSPDALPEVRERLTWASVECMPTDKRQWYVLRVTYSRERKACNHIMSHGIDAYLPMRRIARRTEEPPIRITYVEKPFIPNIIFVHTTRPIVESLVKGDLHIKCITPYYDHFSTNAQGVNDYLTVPERQMQNFIRITRINDRHIRLVTPEQCHYKSGDTVRITEGRFKGITGQVARIGGQQRVVVTLDGVCSIATAYVPTAFLEKYCEEEPLSDSGKE